MSQKRRRVNRICERESIKKFGYRYLAELFVRPEGELEESCRGRWWWDSKKGRGGPGFTNMFKAGDGNGCLESCHKGKGGEKEI